MIMCGIYNILLLFIICITTTVRCKRLDVRMLLEENDLANKLMDLAEELSTLKSQVAKQEEQLAVQQDMINQKIGEGGSAYVRWGRTSCPDNGTERIYKGYTAGPHYSNYGGGVNYLCLPRQPTWARYLSGFQKWRGHVFGVEFDSHTMTYLFGKQVHNENPPCAMCRTTRPVTVMIPARASCYPGWTLEYTGYLMSGDPQNSASTDYACVDSNPEYVTNGSANGNEAVMYAVEAHCGVDLPCPPYVDGRELACSVCSK